MVISSHALALTITHPSKHQAISLFTNVWSKGRSWSNKGLDLRHDSTFLVTEAVQYKGMKGGHQGWE